MTGIDILQITSHCDHATSVFLVDFHCWEPNGKVSLNNTDTIVCPIGHFQVLLCLRFKTSLSAKPFIWKWALHAVSFSCKSVIFIRMVSHLDSFWNREAQGNSEMVYCSVQRTTLQFSARWPGLWMAVRLGVTLLWYRPLCFCHENAPIWHKNNLICTTKAVRSVSSKVTSSLAAKSLTRQL